MRLLFIAMASAFVLSSCHYIMGERIRGNGHITTRNENVGSFNSIEVGGAIEVHIKQESTESVKIETDENLMEFIDVFTDGNTLIIRTKHGYNLDPSREVVAYVSAPAFRGIGVSGASQIVGDNAISVNNELNLGASGASKIILEVSGGNLKGDISGASNLNLKGQVAKLDMQASGASHVKAYDLIADDAYFDCSGASSAEITANKNLRVEASGASHIRYKGNASVSQNTSGASSISKEG